MSMATVRELLEGKGSQVVWTIGPQATVLQGTLLMREHEIGALVVLDEGRVAGIFTERDVLWKVIAEHRDPAQTSVGDVMTVEVICCSPETPIDEARSAMKNRRIRHLPVAADGGLVGVISIGDLNAHQQASQEQTLFLMSEYIYGRV
jgi:CBS domain-containing protein